jgi:hypothetical protein
VDAVAADLARMYRETRQRLTALVAGLDEVELGAPVPACPGWSVADVIGHLAAIPEDALAGRLTGPPSEEETAAQVYRPPASSGVAGRCESIFGLWWHRAHHRRIPCRRRSARPMMTVTR